MTKYKTTRIWEETLQLLRFMSGATGITMVELMHELVVKEYEKRKRRGDFDKHASREGDK